MSYVTATPELIASAATDVTAIGSTLSAAHTAAAASTVGVIPAAADEVSVGIAHLFSQSATDYQAAAAQAAAFQKEFVQHLTSSASSYAAAEAASAGSLQQLGASVSSAASAITDVPGQLAVDLTNLWNSLVSSVELFIQAVETIVYLGYLVTWLGLVFDYFVLAFAGLLVRAKVLELFGITLPLFNLPVP